ncbi:UDP-N-acetylglucosamine 1-carboxyvinyltransferase, partial [human gut metagenome]
MQKYNKKPIRKNFSRKYFKNPRKTRNLANFVYSAAPSAARKKRDTMAVFKVEGGHRLHGSITPQGAKNEALQILCATLLTPERVTVHNIPQILDVMQLIELLRAMGVEVDRLSDDTYSFRAREIDFDYLRT